MELFVDFADLLAAFGQHGVRYLLIGGYAIALHGRPRYTKDLDLWLQSSPDNLTRAIAALEDFGAPESVIDDLRASSPSDVVWFGVPPVRVDLLQRIGAFEFDDVWPGRATMELAGVQVEVIGLAQLIAVKRDAGRPLDLIDAEHLQAMLERSG